MPKRGFCENHNLPCCLQIYVLALLFCAECHYEVFVRNIPEILNDDHFNQKWKDGEVCKVYHMIYPVAMMRPNLNV